jgi:hypothetical protein
LCLGDLETFLTTAEKQRLILHELENLRFQKDLDHLPGYEELSFYVEEAISEYRVTFYSG